MSLTVAIIGRPNVGKSTLFNRLTGRRQALVDDMPGVTRDRREGKANLGDLEFNVVDTAGLEEADKDSLQGRMTAQSEAAIREADVVLMLIDARAGITPGDRHFAAVIRKTHKPVVLAANKAETERAGAAAVAEAYTLGLGDPVAISAEHGAGMVELYEALKSLVASHESLELLETSDQRLETSLTIAILGRPNVGKSTLFNRILGEERTLTGPEAGITRDAITLPFTYEGHSFKLVDTAGLRRKANVTGKVEKLAVADAISAMHYAQVVVLVIDGNAPLEKQDNIIASLIEQEGRAVVVAVNKWDEIEDKDKYLKAIAGRIDKVLPQLRGVAVVPVSAKRGYGIDKLMKACLRAHQLWNREISTGELNRWLAYALSEHTPPLIDGRRLKIRYMTQKTARPPTFLMFANISDIPESYLRYLANSMRENFDLPGVPLRFRIRKGNNPYAKE